MFYSGISVKELIKELNAEVDIALDIPNATYVQWLNSLQQLLYTEVIKEQKLTTFGKVTKPVYGAAISKGLQHKILEISDAFSFASSEEESHPRFEDIYTIFFNGVQLIKSTVTSGTLFPNTYFKENNDIGYYAYVEENNPDFKYEWQIIYFVKPALVKVDDNDEIIDAKVMLPVEFIDLAKAKLRGEAYKLANEDSLAAKWLNDYNILLETFKSWIADKSPNFGM